MGKSDVENTRKPRQRGSRIAATLKVLMRTRISAGLIIVLPLWVTILLVKFVFETMRDASLWFVEALLRSPLGADYLDKLTVPKPAGYDAWGQAAKQFIGETAKKIPVSEKLHYLTDGLGQTIGTREFFKILPETVEWGTAIFSVLLTVFTLYMIGLFTKNIVGRKVIDTYEHFLDQVPLVKTIYRSSKQILATFAGEQSQEFQRAALVPFPQEKMRCVGFITAIFNDSETGEELATVFIPTTPNPTTGYLQILKRKELVELDWSVEDAVRTIMSGGILRPDYLTIVPEAAKLESPPPIRELGDGDGDDS